MQRFLMLPLLMLIGCAYNAPVRPAAINNAAVLAMPIDTAWSRTLQVLAGEGALVKTADRSQGLIATDKHAVQLTEQDADCGNIWGISYLKDSRTTAEVAYAVYLQSNGQGTSVTVNTTISALFNASSMDPGKRLTCYSSGTLERKLLETIASP